MRERTVRVRATGLAAVLGAIPGFTVAATLTAVPDPIQVCDGTGLGAVTLSWNAADAKATAVEVHVGSASGQLFAVGQTVGSATTGKWVANAMDFILIDGTSKQELAHVQAKLTAAGCPASEPSKGLWQRILGWFGR